MRIRLFRPIQTCFGDDIMTTSRSDLESLVARVERLESQYRWFKSEVVTERVVLVDADGKTKATLCLSERGPELDLYDEDGNRRAILGVSAEGPFLALYNAKTRERLELIVDKSGPGLGMLDADGNARVL